MARLDVEQRIFIVESMITTKSLILTKRRFSKTFGKEVSFKAIKNLHSKWQTDGPVRDQHQGRSGRPSSARNPTNAAIVKEIVERGTRTSVRKISAASGIKKSSVHLILKKDLHLKPYKIQEP